VSASGRVSASVSTAGSTAAWLTCSSTATCRCPRPRPCGPPAAE
jgi:hypothetical protein